ncbi:MAG: hypothetical protein U0520_05440 [Candidatus Saccharimonadales bacterium]
MQSPNNTRRKVIIILVVLAITATTAVLLTRSTSKIDKPSGEEISDPKNRESESYGVDKDAIVFYGTSELSRAGVSEFMVNTFREQLQSFSAKRGDYIKKVSVYTTSIALQSNDTNSTINFDILINDKDRSSVKIEYESLLEARVTVYDSKNAKVIDSGLVKHRLIPDEDYTGDGAPPENHPH